MSIDNVEIADLKHKWIAGVEVKPALFSGPTGREDLQFAATQLEAVERDVAAMLFKNYQSRYEKHSAKSANINLRKAVTLIISAQGVFAVPVSKLASQKQREEVATHQADQCIAIVSNLTHALTVPMDAVTLLREAMTPVRGWGFSPVVPDERKGVDDIYINMAVAAVLRLQDAKWWLRKITAEYERYREFVKILNGFVRKGVNPYVSYGALVDFRNKKTAQGKWLASMDVVNEEQGITLSLAEAHGASVSNPEIRRTELMVRMRGFEDLAVNGGFVGEFYTVTAPSKYHPWTTRGGSKGRAVKNRKYSGATPRETQVYLCGQWAKVRAKLAREGIAIFGFRVVEPHHDASPHWHLLLFVKPGQRDQLREIMQAYACEHDPEELTAGTRARFDYTAIDPAKGSATGYIAKYIAKNLQGVVKVGEDWEAETALDTTMSVAAWASLWGIRQFQQIGGPAVTVWRELRRLREAVGDPIIEKTRAAADLGDWAEFIEAMGGVDLPRAERPVQLAHLFQPCASKYGEDIKKLIGVSRNEGAPIRTRVDGWKITRRSVSGVGGCSGERSEVPLSGGSPRTRSSVSNYTEHSLGSELAQSLAHAGLDPVDLERMQRGAVVVAGELFHWVRSGRLYQSKNRPQFKQPGKKQVLDGPDVEQWARDAAGAWSQNARQVLAGTKDLYSFIESASCSELEPALFALDNALDNERKAAPVSYRGDRRFRAMATYVNEKLTAIRKKKLGADYYGVAV